LVPSKSAENKKMNKKIEQTWVDKEFKKALKIAAAKENKSAITITKELKKVLEDKYFFPKKKIRKL